MKQGFLGVLAKVLGYICATVGVAAILSGCQIVHELVQSHSLESIPPDSTGVAWVACRNTAYDDQAVDTYAAEQRYCLSMAKQVCNGPAVYLDDGTGLPGSNFYRERFQCVAR